jgi:cation diffusion facilitator family transporter
MHVHSNDGIGHDHAFLGERHDSNARRTLFVVALTAAMMVAEIIGGAITGSMALVADGWHMATHAGALGISAIAYSYARRLEQDRRFAFGTGKFGDLAAFASAIVLVVVALLVGYESLARFARPVTIAYDEALVIAAIGLAVNIASAFILYDGHSATHAHNRHDHAHGHAHGHGTGHRHGAGPGSGHGSGHGAGPAQDNNLRAAYIHVLADAATSVTAIIGLVAARLLDFTYIDPAVALLGVVVILWWSIGLIRDSASVLLDCVPDRDLAETIRRRLEAPGDAVTDLHLWQLGPGHKAAIVSVKTQSPQPPATYKARLSDLETLCHVTIEVMAEPEG